MNTAVRVADRVRLFRREPGALFWILLFPTLLLVILGSIPSFRNPRPTSAARTIDVYVPVAVLLGRSSAACSPCRRPSPATASAASCAACPPPRSARPPCCRADHGLRRAPSWLRAAGPPRRAVRLRRAAARATSRIRCGAGPGRAVALALGAVIPRCPGRRRSPVPSGPLVFFPSMFCAGVWFPVQAMPDSSPGSSVHPVRRGRRSPEPGRGRRLAGLDPPGRARRVDGAARGRASRWFRWE